MKRVPFSLSWFLVLLGWWLLLVDSLVPAEILAGLAVALFAVLLGRRVQRRGELHFQPRLRWLRWLRSLPAGIFHDGILLLVVLWRRLIWRERPHSDLRLVPFPVGADDPESAARRAFAIFVTALAPNTYVIGFDRERGVALVHQLAITPPEQTRHSVAGTEPI